MILSKEELLNAGFNRYFDPKAANGQRFLEDKLLWNNFIRGYHICIIVNLNENNWSLLSIRIEKNDPTSNEEFMESIPTSLTDVINFIRKYPFTTF